MRIRGTSTNLYGWMERRRLDGQEPALAPILADAAQAGLDAVEIDPEPAVVPLLAACGLRASAVYVGLPLHLPFANIGAKTRVLPAARRLAEAGGSDVLINADPKGGWASPGAKTEEELRRQGDNLSRLAALVRPFGLRLAFHNHAADHERACGDLRSVVAYAAPEVGLCVDVGWAHTAGCDPLGWIGKHPGRITAVHLRNQRRDVPTEDLTEGDLDMAALLAALDAAGYDGWLALELWHRRDTAAQRTMLEDTRRSLALLTACLQARAGGGSP